jgi:hypothetical protein
MSRKASCTLVDLVTERPSYLGKWAQFGVPATIWFTQQS